jgi:hypothetical protein
MIAQVIDKDEEQMRARRCGSSNPTFTSVVAPFIQPSCQESSEDCSAREVEEGENKGDNEPQ